MRSYNSKEESLDFVRSFEQGWIQYKSNFRNLIPLGIASSVPVLFFYLNIAVGILMLILLQGLIFLLLAENVVAGGTLGSRKVHYTRHMIWKFFKNGLVLTLFLFPLLIIGFVMFIIPSVILLSLFIFSFFVVVSKDKFAIDACMESLRQGFGYRLHLFLLSLIFYAGMIVLYILAGYCPLCFAGLSALIIPYFFCVTFEFYEQLEKK
jgi:hypothetical protein